MTVKLKVDDLANGRKSLYLDTYIDQHTIYRKGLNISLEALSSREELEKLAESFVINNN